MILAGVLERAADTDAPGFGVQGVSMEIAVTYRGQPWPASVGVLQHASGIDASRPTRRNPCSEECDCS